MSTAFAIAAVSSVLRTLLDSALKSPSVDIDSVLGSTVSITALPPDRVNPTAGTDPDQLNLFLHGVSENPGWRNLGLPTRNTDGDRVDSPPLALDLHYMLTAYGSKELYAEALLGLGMQVLHEIPYLTRQRITDTLQITGASSNFDKALNLSALADQIEQIKISPAPLTLGDISQLWTGLQGRYRPTASYIVTVVLIQSQRSSKSALPVLSRNIQTLPFAQLVLDSVVNVTDDSAPIFPGTPVALTGSGLNSAQVVLFDGLDVTSAVTLFAGTKILLTLPNPLPSGLRTGLVAAQVVQPIPGFSNPQSGFVSNSIAFAIRPSIAPTVLTTTSSTLNGVTVHNGNIQLTFTTPVGADQHVTLLLNEQTPPTTRPAYAYRFDAPAGNGIVAPATDTTTVVVSYQYVVPGTYLARAQVDGAESVLSLTAGKFSSPSLVI